MVRTLRFAPLFLVLFGRSPPSTSGAGGGGAGGGTVGGGVAGGGAGGGAGVGGGGAAGACTAPAALTQLHGDFTAYTGAGARQGFIEHGTRRLFTWPTNLAPSMQTWLT